MPLSHEIRNEEDKLFLIKGTDITKTQIFVLVYNLAEAYFIHEIGVPPNNKKLIEVAESAVKLYDYLRQINLYIEINDTMRRYNWSNEIKQIYIFWFYSSILRTYKIDGFGHHAPNSIQLTPNTRIKYDLFKETNTFELVEPGHIISLFMFYINSSTAEFLKSTKTFIIAVSTLRRNELREEMKQPFLSNYAMQKLRAHHDIIEHEFQTLNNKIDDYIKIYLTEGEPKNDANPAGTTQNG